MPNQVFKEYEVLLDEHLTKFAQERGYADARECFEKIEEAVAEDKIRSEERMKRMMERMQQAQERWRAEQAAKSRLVPEGEVTVDEGKESEDSQSKEGKESDEKAAGNSADSNKAASRNGLNPNAPPVYFMSVPVTLERMMNMVMNLGAIPYLTLA